MTDLPQGPQPLVYEPFDPDYLRGVIREIFEPMCRHYFRPRLLGAHRIPAQGPAILAANHSGNAFPYDAMVLDGLLWQREGMTVEGKFRSVFEKELTMAWWMRPFGIDNFWRRGGGVDMTFDNFDRLLARGDRVLYYPEGVPGIGKGFQRRYQLQRFSSSFVILAARNRAPVFPVHIVNAEWVIPFCFTWKPLDRLLQRLFKVPFLPLPAAPLGILFPWMWYLTLPARMVFVVEEPIDMAARVAAAGVTDLENPDRERMRQVAEEVRREMQAQLDRHVAQYGRWPYQFRSLRRELWRARRKMGRVLPTGWPVAFLRHYRNRHRPPAKNAAHALLRDLDLAGYYLPLGWPLLSLIRNLRRPPCGYRGLTGHERRELEGNFHWRLAERPLPPRGVVPEEDGASRTAEAPRTGLVTDP